jgi:Icc-related predicted phosphoesterase
MEVKIVAFSDTHGFHRRVKLPECDIAIFAGDLSPTGQFSQVADFMKWYETQTQCTSKVFIAGNHDRSFDPKFRDHFKLDEHDWLRELKETHSYLTYLEDSSVELFGLKIWGSPWTPWFHGDTWGFNKRRGEEIREVWKKIPKDTDIIVTHGPMFGKLDYTVRDKQRVGCEELYEYIKFVDPKLHICGHIHEGYGMDYWTEGTTFVNAAICTIHNEPKNEPITITLEV